MTPEEIGFFREDFLDGCDAPYASVFASEPWGTRTARERLVKIYRSPGFEGSVCVVGGRPPTRLEDRLREVGVGSVFLFTGLGIPAKDLYEKNGYGGVTDMAAKVKVL